MSRYNVKRRSSVEAFQVQTDDNEAGWPEWAKLARAKHEDEAGAIILRPILPGYLIETYQGRIIVEPGDWIIRNDIGEITGCKDETFKQTFEPEE